MNDRKNNWWSICISKYCDNESHLYIQDEVDGGTMVRSGKGTDTAMTDGGGDSGTMIINPTAENTMIRNDTAGLSTMTSALGTMVINEEEGNNDTAKGLWK